MSSQEARPVAKSVLSSKTWIANISFNMVLASAMELSPHVSAFAQSHPQTVVLVASLMNLVLRHYTTEPIEYSMPKKETK